MNESGNELMKHLESNEKMWSSWMANGINPETEFSVGFNFYASSESARKALCAELKDAEILYTEKHIRTLLIFKGWQVTASIAQKWSLVTLQGKTGYMYVLSKQTDTLYEGVVYGNI